MIKSQEIPFPKFQFPKFPGANPLGPFDHAHLLSHLKLRSAAHGVEDISSHMYVLNSDYLENETVYWELKTPWWFIWYNVGLKSKLNGR